MTMTPLGAEMTLSVQVARQIRSVMGWHDVRQSELARRLGENDQWLSMRLKGRTPIDLNELQRIAEALGVPVVELIPATARQQPGNANVRSGFSTGQRTGHHPITRPPRGPGKITSPVPPTRRRPTPARPPVQTMAHR